jgi:hypothetical protein
MEGGADSGDNKMITDMDEHGTMRKDVAGFAKSAIDQLKSEWEIAKFIKESLDKKYGPCWVCIVGQEFRMHCSHIAKTFMFFYVGKVAICVYQTEY